MSRRYPAAEAYDERATDFYARPRNERNYDELDIDIRERTRAPRADTVLSDRRTERGPRQPDFLRDDYGKSAAGPLVIREERRDDDVYSRAPTRRRSNETVRSRAPPQHVNEREIIIRERDGERKAPYPPSERGDYRDEEIIYRDQARSRATSRPPARTKEEIDITIRKEEDVRSEARSRPPPARSEAPRSEYHERDVEEIRFRRGGGDMPPRPRTVVNEEFDIRERRGGGGRTVIDEEIDIRERRGGRTVVDEEIEIRERRGSPNRSSVRGRGGHEEEIDIRIRDRSVPPPRARSQGRGVLVGRKEEEWIVRRPRSPSPPPPREIEKEQIIIRRRERSPTPPPALPPPRDYEREEIIIRRREREITPPPAREPTPPPPPPPMPEPIVRPPIIQEVITHHRHIDHGVERYREPTPSPPPPAPPSPPREENLEIAIHRSGTRNGKHYDEELIIDHDHHDHHDRSRGDDRQVSHHRSHSGATRRRSPSAGPIQRRRPYDDDIGNEADYYNQRAASRGYPGEAYNGATRDWGLVDVPPGTERVRMDGAGGGSQEISWQRYNGERQSKFRTGDRTYDSPDWQNGTRSPPPAALPPPPVPAPPREEQTNIRIRINEETQRGKTRDKMWTEITKDLVIKEAIDEKGYEYEETDDFFYVIEYLRYEDVLKLVELTEDIRRQRRERIRELQWEREEIDRAPKMIAAPPPPPIPAPPRSVFEERIYEREYYSDRDGSRRYRR